MPRPKLYKNAKGTRTVTVTLSDDLLKKAQKIQKKHGFGSLAYAIRKGFEWAPENPKRK